MQCFEKSFKPQPQAVLLNEAFNIAHWLFSSLDKMWGHSDPHVYNITRKRNGQAQVTYKNWSTDKVRLMVAIFLAVLFHCHTFGVNFFICFVKYW